MSKLRQAAQQALEALTIATLGTVSGKWPKGEEAIKALRQALKAEQSAEGVTKLPDGSAFAVMSYPLPKNHWLYAPRQYAPGAEGPIELPEPILNHEVRDTVVAAIRYAIRGATMCGQEPDFDPDALVQNAVYALCGAYTHPQPAQQDEPVAAQIRYKALKKGLPGFDKDWGPWQPTAIRQEPPPCVDTVGYAIDYRLLYTHPQPAQQPLTDEQIVETLMPLPVQGTGYFLRIARAVERAHGIGGEK